MKAMCLLTENPCPPRNGITIPTHNHLKILRDIGYELNILLIEDVNKELCSFGNARKLKLTETSKFRRIITELTLKRAYYENLFDFEQLSSEEINVDVIYYSPISFGYVVTLLAAYIKKKTGKKPIVIASISDCYTSVLRTSLSNSKGITVKSFASFLRSFLISRLEFKALSNADSILVQTKKDKEWLLNIGLQAKNIFITPNGVSDSLFNLKMSNYTDLVFVGNFRSDFYIDKLGWFINNVFLRLIENYPKCNLHIYTSGTCSEKLDIITEHKNINVHNEFVKDIADVYKDKYICVAPIFKSYGFINKVAEALGAGLVVVGDKSAFNGMNVRHGRDAFIVETEDEFFSTISDLLGDKKQSMNIRTSARYLAMNDFSWSSRKEIFINATNSE